MVCFGVSGQARTERAPPSLAGVPENFSSGSTTKNMLWETERLQKPES